MQIEAGHGNQHTALKDGGDLERNRTDAARDAGFSKHQQVQAIRRAGELLQQIEPGQGARDGKRGEGDHTPFNRESAAREAGFSKHQQVQAIRRAGELLRQD